MSHAVSYDHRFGLDDRYSRLALQTDILIDAISGSSRQQLEGLPVAVIYERLCTQLRAMGLVPAEDKVRRIAVWISGSDPEDDTPGSWAA